MADATASALRHRAAFPLWAKLGLLFGGIFGSFIAGYNGWQYRAELAHQEERQEAQLRGLAILLAMAVEGDVYRTYDSPEDQSRGSFQRYRTLLQQAKEVLNTGWLGTTTRDDKGRYHYVIESDEDAPFEVGYPVFDGYAERNRVYQGEVVYAPAFKDEWGSWAVAFAPIRDSDGRVVGVLEVNEPAGEVIHRSAERARTLQFQTLLAVMVSLLIAIVVAHQIARHLGTLTRSALKVAAGDLRRSVSIDSSDEIGVLADAFNVMVLGLRERERIQDTFGRFVSPEVAARVLQEGSGLRLLGERRRVTVLMSDLRGFTALSVELGPEEMVELLNRYIVEMTEVIVAHGGTVSELVGDGIVALFGAPEAHEDDEYRAVCCAIAMQVALDAFNAREGRRLQMGIGVDTGEVIAGTLGGAQRMKYGVVGQAINLAARLEGLTVGSQVLLSDETHAALGAAIETSGAGQVLVKGREEALGFHVALATRGHRAVRMPERSDPSRAVDLPISLQRVEGKNIAPEVRVGRVREVSAAALRVTFDSDVAPRDTFRAELRVDAERTARGIDLRVRTVDGDDVLFAIVAAPEQARSILDWLAAPREEGTLPGQAQSGQAQSGQAQSG